MVRARDVPAPGKHVGSGSSRSAIQIRSHCRSLSEMDLHFATKRRSTAASILSDGDRDECRIPGILEIGIGPVGSDRRVNIAPKKS